jgi:hypothetical protein
VLREMVVGLRRDDPGWRIGFVAQATCVSSYYFP